MFFLIRMAFWLSLVLLLLPLGSVGDDGPSVNPLQALLAAREAVGDVAGMCERKPEVCETGKAALETIGVRAREGARLAIDMLDDQKAAPVPPAEVGLRDPAVTGGIPAE